MMKRGARVGAAWFGMLASATVALLLTGWLLRPPAEDMVQLAVMLVGSAIASLLVGLAAYRLGWLDRLPRLEYALIGGYVVAALITLTDVWVSARLMFLNDHDFLLASALLGVRRGHRRVAGPAPVRRHPGIDWPACTASPTPWRKGSWTPGYR